MTPTNNSQRTQLHRLCHYYGVKTQTYESGKRMNATLTKRSLLMPDYEAIEFVKGLSGYMDVIKTPTKSAPVSRNNSEKKAKKQATVTPTKGGMKKVVLTPPVVGSTAAPISDSNVGHQLLQKMGWVGGGLGANEQGITNPIPAYYKQKRTGLGF